MSPTDKVLGQIAAINTLIENFPMSILDMMHGKQYTSVFEFLIDVLNACGVNTNEIIEYILSSIYGFEETVEGGIQGLYDSITMGAIEWGENPNEFMEMLEYGMKGILMALFTSIFTCSAIPVLPNKVFDADGLYFEEGPGEGLMNDLAGWMNLADAYNFVIPVRAIDMMGMLNYCPTTTDGMKYYAIQGRDRYFKKTKVYDSETIEVEKIATETKTEEKTIDIPIKKDKYPAESQIPVMLQVTSECGGWTSEVEWKFFVNNGVSHPDIKIYVNYTQYESPNASTWEGTIPSNGTESDILLLCPKDDDKPAKASKINWIKINNVGTGAEVGEGIWAYLDKTASFHTCAACYSGTTSEETGGLSSPLIAKEPVSYSDNINHWTNRRWQRLKNWTSLWRESNWGQENHEQIDSAITSAYTVDMTVESAYTDYETVITERWEYKECEMSDVDLNTITRTNFVPENNINDEEPATIVYYDGLNPNTLYKTNDMNAFIWYVLNKGMVAPQVEYNHMMWDSRVSAAKKGVTRGSAEEWNEWYDSKAMYYDEFMYEQPVYGEGNSSTSFRIRKDSELYPIIQLEKLDDTKEWLRIHIPSQRYFRPRKRNALIAKYDDGDENVRIPSHAFNASIYKFDWEYLENIQILHPKIIIVRMCEYLLGLTLDTVGNLDFNLTKKIIQAKVTSAIKKIIEADDMEVEDCYTTFSNDEVNEMLNEMLMEKYKASNYSGDVNKARQRNATDYMSIINSTNSSAVRTGTTSQLSRLMNEVTVVGKEDQEPTISYGIKVDFDRDILQKLLWAIVMPIVESLLTPEVLLLILINFELLGVTNLKDVLGHDYGLILNSLLNKILGLIKSIILYVKDMLITILLKLFYERVLPLLIKWKLLVYLEMINNWLVILKAALACLPTFKFKRTKIIGGVDDVNYADIIASEIDNIGGSQDTPQSTSQC